MINCKLAVQLTWRVYLTKETKNSVLFREIKKTCSFFLSLDMILFLCESNFEKSVDQFCAFSWWAAVHATDSMHSTGEVAVSRCVPPLWAWRVWTNRPAVLDMLHRMLGRFFCIMQRSAISERVHIHLWIVSAEPLPSIILLPLVFHSLCMCGNEAASPTFLEQNNLSKVYACGFYISLPLSNDHSLVSRLSPCILHFSSQFAPTPPAAIQFPLDASREPRTTKCERTQADKAYGHTCFRT